MLGSRNCLILKNGIEGKILENSYLSQREQKVGLNPVLQAKNLSLQWALGPLLFLVNIDDIDKNLRSFTRLFADVSSLFCSAALIADIAGIFNHDLQLLSNWDRQWLVIPTFFKKQRGYCNRLRLSVRYAISS